MENRRLLPVAVGVAAVCALSGCGGMSASSGLKQAKEVRSSTAPVYWKVRDALPATFYEPDGQGSFVKCSKSPDELTYTVEDYLQPRSSEPTMQQLLSVVESSLRPQGWRFTSEGELPNALANEDFLNAEKLYGYIARKGGVIVHLTLHEKRGSDPAAGYLNVSSACRKYGGARKQLLADYAGGDRDGYRQSAQDPTPVPTGFPTPDV
jgi:hypothetical protein